MSSYEKMKNDFYLQLETIIPGLTNENMALIGKALDMAAHSYDIVPKETSLTVYADPIPNLVKTYIVVKKTEGLSEGTLSNYYLILRNFFLWARKQPHEITANDIRMFVYNYQGSNSVSDRTLDKYREYICWFFHWAYNEEYIPKDPAKAVKRIKYEIKERQALTQLELEYIRLACRDVREKAIIEFMYSTGCRVSEMVNVKKTDIDWKEGYVRLFGKGKKHRKSFINAKCEVALKEYLDSRMDESEYLFVSRRKPHGKIGKCAVEKVIRELSERANISKDVTPHVIRHTTATQAVNNGMPIEDVSKLLGHANVATTMIYAKVSEENVKTQHSKYLI